MNQNPKTFNKTRTIQLDNKNQPRKLKLPLPKTNNNLPAKRRSNSVTSNASSISDKTVITRQTIRSDIQKAIKDKNVKEFIFDSAENTFLSDNRAKSDTPKVTNMSFKKPVQKSQKHIDPSKIELETISEVG